MLNVLFIFLNFWIFLVSVHLGSYTFYRCCVWHSERGKSSNRDFASKIQEDEDRMICLTSSSFFFEILDFWFLFILDRTHVCYRC